MSQSLAFDNHEDKIRHQLAGDGAPGRGGPGERGGTRTVRTAYPVVGPWVGCGETRACRPACRSSAWGRAAACWSSATARRCRRAPARWKQAGSSQLLRASPARRPPEGDADAGRSQMMPSEGPPALQMREGTAGGDRRKHELCIVAVSRIQGWLKHSGKQLSDLFSQIDTDGSGDFDVSEFRAARTPLNKRRCRAAHTHTHPRARARAHTHLSHSHLTTRRVRRSRGCCRLG